MKKIVAYVKSIDDKPLEPMYSSSRVRKLLKDGRAIIVSHKPFVIKLTYKTSSFETQTNHLGCDTGRTNIANVVIDNNGNIKYSAHIETSNKDVPKNMAERAQHRRASRQGERKRRQRRAITNNTTFKHTEVQERILPKCKKPINNKHIKNTEAKFANRKREVGWLTPTARHLLNTIVTSIDMAVELLPINTITIEVTKWDFAKLNNPNIKNWEYQKGRLFSFDSVEDAVSDMQNNKCLCCEQLIDVYHHLIPRHLGGSDTIDNIAGLCKHCHQKIHTDKAFKETVNEKHTGLLKQYYALSVMNQIMPYLLTVLTNKYPNIDIYVTNGKDTALTRKLFNLPKTHIMDAWCIASTQINIDKITPSIITNIQQIEHYKIKQFRNNNRAIINNQRERTYKYQEKIIARNRKARFEQKDNSLEEWFKNQIALHGLETAEKMRSQLDVIKSTRYYNDKNRVMPGAVFLYKGKRFVLSGQITNGLYYRAIGQGKRNFPARECTIIQQNDNLVYV